MRWIADGVVYFDYSVEGEPALCMQRRGSATVYNLDLSKLVVGSIDLAPRIDLLVEELKVFYARRETVANKRVTVWDSETAGEVTSGLPRRQPALISGPEIDTYLPQDFTDSVVVQSATLRTGGAVKGAVFQQYEERLRAAGATGMNVGTFTEASAVGGPWTLQAVPTRVTDADGNAIDPSFARYLTKGEIKDWWTKDGIEHVQARITATIWNRVYHGFDTVPDPPLWFTLLGGNVVAVPLIGTPAIMHVWSTTVSVTVPLVKTAWPVDTTLIRAEDYAFVNPPAGLAANLLATQNWLPYEGTVGPIPFDDIPATSPVGGVLNISNFLPETADMKALISGCNVRLATGTITYTVGAPSRFAYRDLVNRFRQSGADNIVWLVDSVSGDPEENLPDPPVSFVPPSIARVAPDSSTLVYTPGSWSGASSVTWEWYLGDVATGETGEEFDGESISGAVKVIETATNDAGTVTRPSNTITLDSSVEGAELEEGGSFALDEDEQNTLDEDAP